MENSLLIALSRQDALQRQMNVIANNIANMNTTAFKGERMMFVQHLVANKGSESRTPDSYAMVRDLSTVRNTGEGPIQMTSNPLDVAIHGDGYFAVQTADGERYTRNGHFRLDQSGQLVTQEGAPVLSDSGQPFYFAPTDGDISIARDGTVSTNNGQIGRLRVVTFDNENDLKIVAGGLYSTDAQPKTSDTADVVQGALEGSNVQPIVEMTRMIEVHRAYDNASQMIDKEDQRIRKMISELTNSATA